MQMELRKLKRTRTFAQKIKHTSVIDNTNIKIDQLQSIITNIHTNNEFKHKITKIIILLKKIKKHKINRNEINNNNSIFSDGSVKSGLKSKIKMIKF